MSLEQERQKLIKKIAGNIKALRKEAGLTQEQMRDFNFNYRYYQKIESGAVEPSLFTLLRLSKVFKVKIKDLLE